MLSLNEKNKIKEILSQGLRINPNINFAYFLEAIDDTNNKVAGLSSKLNEILYNQRIIERKLNDILSSLER